MSFSFLMTHIISGMLFKEINTLGKHTCWKPFVVVDQDSMPVHVYVHEQNITLLHFKKDLVISSFDIWAHIINRYYLFLLSRIFHMKWTMNA